MGGEQAQLAPDAESGARRRLMLRATVIVAITVVGYQYSITTILRGLGDETPLAYIGLVPLIAVLLAGALAVRPDGQRDIHDRFLDYYVGVPLLGIAMAIVVAGPLAMSTFFWYWRLDLISLPLFIAGAIALVFGVRSLWRVRIALFFLFLAWPPPYTLLLSGWLNDVSTITLSLVHGLLRAIPVATPLPYGDGSLFQITHGGHAFILSVASACSGVNSVLGFLLVGVAATALVRGPRVLKALWLVAGIALIWGLDVLRIVLIFWVAQRWGEDVAMNVLHPFVGMVFFSAGVLVMILVMRHFRLRLLGLEAAAGQRGAVRTTTTRQLPVRRVRVPMAIVALAGAGVAIVDVGMNRFELLSQDLGPPRIHSFSVGDVAVSGWSATPVSSYPWVRLYFGSDATWERYAYSPSLRAVATSDAEASPITVDVIRTSDLMSFNTYGVEACYHFHDYSLDTSRTVELGGGLAGHVVSYQVPRLGTWTAVYWVWPIGGDSGQRYERIVLNQSTSVGRTHNEHELEGFARQMVFAAAQRSRGGMT